MNENVNFFFSKNGQWQDCYTVLRKLVLASGLTENLKWGNPCYTLGKSNIVLIHGFKDYCALLFFKGALLPDDRKLLIQQTTNVQAARQLRFRDINELLAQEQLVTEYILAAIAVEKQGVKVPKLNSALIPLPPELVAVLAESPELHAAFYALTPGRQRGYALFIEKAKQSDTRIARIEKYRNTILAGKGIDD